MWKALLLSASALVVAPSGAGLRRPQAPALVWSGWATFASNQPFTVVLRFVEARQTLSGGTPPCRSGPATSARMSPAALKDDPMRLSDRSWRGRCISRSHICSVRYYSPQAKRLVIVIARSAMKTRKESIIVLRDEVGYVGLQRAAELLGMNQRAVRNLVSRRRLEAEREGEGVAARLVVSLASVERLRLERQAAGKDSKV